MKWRWLLNNVRSFPPLKKTVSVTAQRWKCQILILIWKRSNMNQLSALPFSDIKCFHKEMLVCSLAQSPAEPPSYRSSLGKPSQISFFWIIPRILVFYSSSNICKCHMICAFLNSYLSGSSLITTGVLYIYFSSLIFHLFTSHISVTMNWVYMCPEDKR